MEELNEGHETEHDANDSALLISTRQEKRKAFRDDYGLVFVVCRDR